VRALVCDHTDVPREPPDAFRRERKEHEYPYRSTYRRRR
jgi:hypothetical protein